MIKQVKSYAITSKALELKTVLDDPTFDWWQSEDIKKHYHAFTTVTYNPKDRLLYCGVTNFGNDILYRFDPVSKSLESLRYQDAPFAERFDIKLHRSVEVDKDGNIYGATSCLHGINKRSEGPGGKVFRYTPSTGEYTLLCIPKKHDYIQTITLDDKRGMIYGFTYPVFEFFAYSIKRNAVLFCDYMESITHVSAVDDEGRYWGTWSNKHKFFSYDPATNKVTYHDFGFPEPCRSLMYPNAGPIDCMINGKDGYLYIATENAALYRLNPRSLELDYLGKPFPGTRMPGLIPGDDGLLYGSGGENNSCFLFSYDRSRRTFDILSKIVDTNTGEPCFRTHDIEKVGNVIYVGETDNIKRTNYLWECQIG